MNPSCTLASKKFLVLALAVLGSAFFAFLLGGLTIQPFFGDHAYYASEILCESDFAEIHCSEPPSRGIPMFRGDPQEDTTQQSKDVRYTSWTFARFLNFFADFDDSYREALLKIIAVKASLIALTFVSIFLLLHHYPSLRSTAVRLLAVTFSVPFVLEASAGVYPAGSAIISFLLVLLILKALRDEPNVSLVQKLWLYVGLTASCAVIVSTRFETTALLLLSCLFHFLGQLKSLSASLQSRMLSITPLIIAISLAVSAALINNTTARLAQKAISMQLFIVPSSTPSKSVEIVESVGLAGNFAYLLMAPITMVDNSTRYFLNRTYSQVIRNETAEFSLVSIELLVLTIAVIFAWIPVVVIIGRRIKHSVQSMRRSQSHQELLDMPSLVLVTSFVCFFLIPFLVRGVWSWWYVLPLLMMIMGFDSPRPLVQLEIAAYIIAAAGSVLALAVVNYSLGELEIGGLSFPVASVLAAVLLSGTSLFLLLFQVARLEAH